MVLLIYSKLVIVVGMTAMTALGLPQSQIALPNCPEKCGNVTIPYPFGIGNNCYYSHPSNYNYYSITCNYTKNPPVPIYGENIEVVKITLEGEFRVNNYVSYACYDMVSYNYSYQRIQVRRFPISTSQNSLVAIGCDTYVWFEGNKVYGSQFHSGCMTLCNDDQKDIVGKGACSGVGCCMASIPNGVTNISIRAKSFYNHSFVQDFNPCSVGFVVAQDKLPHTEDILYKNAESLDNLELPMVYDWSIGNKTCASAKEAKECICKGNSTCLDLGPEQWGYRCNCKQGYGGNPYLHGCQDIDECAEENPCEKPAVCVNQLGSYTCRCPRGYRTNGTNNNSCVLNEPNKESMAIKIILGVGGGIIVALTAALGFHWQHGKIKLAKMRESFFHQNGGHILKQKLSGRDVSVGNMVKMFNVDELKKATNNYSESSVIGRGGFGMVYKGTFSSQKTSQNNQVVAIKKSLKVNSSQVEQFINEVVVLSQINNKNVVKLLGCCLETEVPLLVYEYISNGTLYDHLRDESKARFLTWDVRLRIAAEVAEVLAYLHNTISIPIIHRDIKSANILLDENYIAKVSDFGASKLAPVNQDELATIVQGTSGYLDPEYMQTGELTDKSDVYSFGVVLVELLTREKAMSYAKPEDERCLSNYFLRKLKEDRLFEILDDKIVNDGAINQLKEVANLASRCLKLKGEDRPSMKQIARELEGIREMSSHPWSNNGGVLQEETEYLLGETLIANGGYGRNKAVDDPLGSQSRVLEFVPLNDGR